MNGFYRVPTPINEPIKNYGPGSPEKLTLKAKLAAMSAEQIEIPVIIGGQEIRTGQTATQRVPHRHGQTVATYHKAGPGEVEKAIAAATEAKRDWAFWKPEDRFAVFLKAADLLASTWRDTLNAATMLAQSKTIFQAEIDSACETIDFLRFNVHFAQQLLEDQPISGPGVWNRMDYRPLEGFIYAVTPFNFTAISGNLTSAPAMLGNTVVWKPSNLNIYSSYFIYKLFEAAGLPPGVINFVPGDPVMISDALLTHGDLGGVHFTGSTSVFQGMWSTVGKNIAKYKSYPRLVGETGGKDFVVVHPSADPDAALTALVRGAFEYQGQKCSAASRAYLPESLWKRHKDRFLGLVQEITVGDVADFRNFMGAVIDDKSFKKISGYVDHAKQSADAEILAGGHLDDTVGYFVRPTVIQAKRPDYRTMCEEIFGPVLTVYVYRDEDWSSTLDLVNATSPYGLTGAVLSTDRKAIDDAHRVLRHAAGNFYVNDKPTGAVVGQQPFGGSRASGTNDKAGSMLNLIRWVSARTIKETLVPPTTYRYPFMDES